MKPLGRFGRDESGATLVEYTLVFMLLMLLTFGLIEFDHETFVRTVKPSARWLGEVARANGAGLVG